ncbi:unnamed protein product, partial [Mesorhabditis spiculigera]
MASALQKHQFTIILSVFQALFFVLFGLFAKYDEASSPNTSGTDEILPLAKSYPTFQDTHVMIFIGFGFLMTFLRRYGFSALSINMLLATFTIEYSIIVRGFLEHSFKEHGHFEIGLEQILTADFAAAVVLISMGAMLGKLSPVQYLIMTIFEIPVACAAEHYVVHELKINDVGGSIIVHAFGAYFGLACSRAFAKKEQRSHENEGSNYHSDTFAMIVANVCLSPLHAIVIGFIAGAISVLGYRYLTPYLSNKLGFHDTCGVHNLHGMPAIIAAIASVAMALHYEPSRYGSSLNIIYPGMNSTANTAGFDQTVQATHQAAALGIVLLAAIVSGFITGFVLKLKFWNQVREKENFADADYFETPSDYDFTTRIASCIDHVDITERTPLQKQV